MIRPALRQILLTISLAIPALCLGCNQHASAGKPAVIAKSTPEERFQRILESIRHKIDGQPFGFVVADGGTRTTMLGTNKVSSKLIPPEDSIDHFRAVITIETESHYSLRRSKNSTAEDTERDQSGKNPNQNQKVLADPKEKKGIGILDPDLAGNSHNDNSQSAPKSKEPGEDTVTRQRDEEVRNYELVDNGGRWVLLTKLDPKTEQSIQFAFDEALARQ
jgi:hypothetical protein